MIVLSKKNFWSIFEEKYPKQMANFLKWIDEYKKDNDWNKIFNSDSDWQDMYGKNAPAPKFHQLPMAMQMGIFAQFISMEYEDATEVEMEDHAKNTVEYYFGENITREL